MEDKLLDDREAIQVGADALRFRATSDETGGEVLAVEVTMPPAAGRRCSIATTPARSTASTPAS